jgi:hypothetical protein
VDALSEKLEMKLDVPVTWRERSQLTGFSLIRIHAALSSHKDKYAKHYGPYLGMPGLLLLCLWHSRALTAVWNLTFVFCFVTSLMLGRPSTSKNEARGLDGAGCDVDEYKHATARTVPSRHIIES